MTGKATQSPESFDAWILADFFVTGDDDELVQSGRGDDEPIKRIFVNGWKGGGQNQRWAGDGEFSEAVMG